MMPAPMSLLPEGVNLPCCWRAILRQLDGPGQSDSSGRFGASCKLYLSDVTTHSTTYKNHPELSFRPVKKNSRLRSATVATGFQ